MRLLETMENLASDGGLLPEQIWDSPDIPERGLFFGHPTGSAMPLVWAHAEYLKLVRSITEERVFDMPPQTANRYLKDNITSKLMQWRFNHRLGNMPIGSTLRIETLAPASICWSSDNWNKINNIETTDSELGIYYADLNTEDIKSGVGIVFTFFWTESKKWEGKNFHVHVL